MRSSLWLIIPTITIAVVSCSSDGPGPVADGSLVGTWTCASEHDPPGLLELSDDHTFELEGFSAGKLAKIYPNYDGETEGVISGAGSWYQNENPSSAEYSEVRFFFEDDVMGEIGNVPVFVGSKSDYSLYFIFTDPDFSERIECGPE